MLNIIMPKSPVAKTAGTPARSKKSGRVKEHKQLYLVQKSGNGALNNGNGFRHHRPKEKRADAPAPKVLNPADAQIDYADNERGAINKLLALNDYYRTHPWPTPFHRNEHRLCLGDARDLAWIPNGSVHLIVTWPPYWTAKTYAKYERQLGAILDYNAFLRKGGEYRSPSPIQKALSMLTKEEMKSWLRSSWVDIKGESTRRGHPAPYPQILAERLIKLFSFAGDTVLDPFVGTGTTNLAAIAVGRNSIGNEIEPAYLKIAEQRLNLATSMSRDFGATHSTLRVER